MILTFHWLGAVVQASDAKWAVKPPRLEGGFEAFLQALTGDGPSWDAPERNALTDLFREMVNEGEESGSNGWCSKKPLWMWRGIHCNSAGNVTRVESWIRTGITRSRNLVIKRQYANNRSSSSRHIGTIDWEIGFLAQTDSAPFQVDRLVYQPQKAGSFD